MHDENKTLEKKSSLGKTQLSFGCYVLMKKS